MIFPFLLAAMLGLSLLAIDFIATVGGHAHSGRWKAVVAVLPIIAELLIRVPPTVTADSFELPEPYRWLATQEQADAVVEFPFGYTDCSCIYQPFHGKCLMGVEGRFVDYRQREVPVDELFGRQPALRRLAAVQGGEEPTPIDLPELEQLYREGFDYLVFRPIDCGKQREFSRDWVVATRSWLEELLGPPVREADGVAVFALPGTGPQNSYCGQSVSRSNQ